jgi:hypothetical protein
LTLQIAFVDVVVIHHADTSDARGCEVLQHGRAEAAGTDAKHACRRKPLLSRDADFRNE